VRAHRLVTLTGMGGVGKTRLALEVAKQLGDEFPDGVWVFELAAVADSAAVPDAVAAVLGIAQQPGKSVADSVAAALEGRVRLLVFDNCEHVLDAVAELFEAILAASATVTILATSREGVGHASEQLWPVPSLDIDAAVDLFVERAHRVAPTFSVVDASAVAEICRQPWTRSVIVSTTASDSLSVRGGAWDATRRSVTRWCGLTTCSETRKGTAGTVFGVRRWVRPRKRLCGSRIR
jgi:predicted ATPase